MPSPLPVLNIAMVGHAFMGKAHANAYRQVGRFVADCPYRVVPKVLVGRKPDTTRLAADKLGFEEWSTDLDAVLARDDIHLVDIVTPNGTHHGHALKALNAGKFVACEKPLAMTAAQARELAETAIRIGKPTLLWHNYRRSPAASTAARLVAEGKLGAIRHARAVYLQEKLADDTWPYTPSRMDRKLCGGGAIVDLGSHLVDMIRFITGQEFTAVCGTQATFVKERRLADGSGMGTVDVDDATLFLARLSGGALASVEATRCAKGRKNHHRIEINGTTGSLVWNFERMNELEFFTTEGEALSQGWRTIICLDPDAHPYAKHFWPNGHMLGYEHTFIFTLADFLSAIHKNTRMRPDFADGLAIQQVLEAVERSVTDRTWQTP